MNSEKKAAYVTREMILKLLSDEEVARVGTAEAGMHLAAGDEYLNLEKLNLGVQKAEGAGPAMGNMLPKRAVHTETWKKVLTQLAMPNGEAVQAAKSGEAHTAADKPKNRAIA